MLNPWMLLAAGVLALSLFTGGVTTGYKYEKAKFDTYKAEIEKQVYESKLRTVVTIENQRRANVAIVEDLKDGNEAINRRYSTELTRLRDKATSTAAMSSLSNATCRAYESSTSPELLGVLQAADLQTKQLVSCQAWIKQQRNIFPEVLQQ